MLPVSIFLYWKRSFEVQASFHPAYPLLLKRPVTRYHDHNDPIELKHTSQDAESEHCFDLSDLISEVGVINIYSRQCIYAEKDFLLVVCNNTRYKNPQKPSLPNPFGVRP